MPRSITKTLSLASIVAVSLALPVQAMANVDIFIKFDDVAGESMDFNHRDWSNVLAWSWGMYTDGKGKTCVQSINLTKYVDSATDELAQSMPANTTFSRVQLSVSRQGDSVGESQNYIMIDMTDVKITSLSTGGSDGEGSITENISFDFGELKGSYIQYGQDGRAMPPQEYLIPGAKCR